MGSPPIALLIGFKGYLNGEYQEILIINMIELSPQRGEIARLLAVSL
jgi:hypothetical protein